MSGGFHPFHPGHLALYQSAKKAFPNADVVVGATNVQKDRPFSFKDKATLAQIAGVEQGHFVEVKRQFAVKGEPNIESRIKDPDNTILILVRSMKDSKEQPQPWRRNSDGTVPVGKKGQPLSDYLLPYDNTQGHLEPMTKHAYIDYLPVREFGDEMTSATQIRNTWPKLNNKQKQDMAMSLYPATKSNIKLLKTVITILNKNLSNTEVTVPTKTSALSKLKNNPLKENVVSLIKNARPLMKEASLEQKFRFMKLLKESIRELGDVVGKEYLNGKQRANLIIKLVDTGKYDISDLELLQGDDLVDLYRQEFTQELDEINLFHINKPNTPTKPPEPTTPSKVYDYHELFKNATNPLDNIPKEKIYHSWEEFDKEQHKSDDVEEARIHQPKYIDLFYVHPKDNRIIKKLVINMPFHRLEAYVQFLKDKGLDINNLRYKAGSKEEHPYGRKISENPDYLEEK
jgi:hypothetical protein